MRVHQLKPYCRMVECCCVEPDELEIFAEVVFVTIRARLIVLVGVKAASLGNSGAKRSVTFETKPISDAAFSEHVAFGAIPHSLEVGVRRGQFARGEELCSCLLRTEQQSDGH